MTYNVFGGMLNLTQLQPPSVCQSVKCGHCDKTATLGANYVIERHNIC